MLKFNISDALEQRKLACERINTLFDVDWSVELPEEIDYEKIEEEERDIQANGISRLMNDKEGDAEDDRKEE